MPNPIHKLFSLFEKESRPHPAVESALGLPTANLLHEKFNKANGVLVNDETGELVAEYSAAAYYMPNLRKPLIVMGPAAIFDSYYAHELRHFQQNKELDLYHFYPLHDDARALLWCEADARAVQALHLIEKRDSLMTMSPVTDYQRHMIGMLLSELRDTMGTKNENDIPAKFKEIIFADTPETARAVKMKFMREVFDAYIADGHSIENFYRKAQLAKMTPSKHLFFRHEVGYALTAVAMGCAYNAGTIVDLSAAIYGLAAGVVMLTTTQPDREKRDMHAVLEKFGTMPDGNGNYLTETKGRPLDSDFYTALPEELDEAIKERETEIRLAPIPFANEVRRGWLALKNHI